MHALPYEYLQSILAGIKHIEAANVSFQQLQELDRLVWSIVNESEG